MYQENNVFLLGLRVVASLYWDREQGLEQIDAFTIKAAYVNSHDDSKGSIKTGKLADLIVIDRNLFEIDPQEISETEVLLTLFDGQPVHGEPGSL